MRMRCFVIGAILFGGFLATGRAQVSTAKIVVAARSPIVLGDDIAVRLEGLEPWTVYRLVADFTNPWGTAYRSSNSFVPGADGIVDLARNAPLSGSYAGADRLGIFWSATRQGPAPAVSPLQVPAESLTLSLTLEQGGRVIGQSRVQIWLSRPGVQRREVRQEGIVADIYEPSEKRDLAPLVVLLGGSGGGMTWQSENAAVLASHGYVAMALAYFGADSLPASLSEIRLEYIRDAIAFGIRTSRADPARVALVGLSRGAEAALLAAAHFPEIGAVVAFAPSAVSFMGQRPPEYPVLASWTLGGKPVPFVTTREIRPYNSADNEAERHLRYLLVHARDVPASTIPVEKIGGPVLLFSGGLDPIWPAGFMTELMTERLKANAFRHDVTRYDFAQAGHVFARPGYQSTMPGGFSGGDPRANAYAQTESWRRTLAFLSSWRDRR